jgi:hypothetical protein
MRNYLQASYKDSYSRISSKCLYLVFLPRAEKPKKGTYSGPGNSFNAVQTDNSKDLEDRTVGRGVFSLVDVRMSSQSCKYLAL